MENTKPKEIKDYSKGKIYRIWNEIDDRIYIGSTCQTLAQRMGEHRRSMNKVTKMKYRIYQIMKEIGVEHFKIELLEECECENNDQLRKREGELIREYKPELNSRIEGRPVQEAKKAYREANKEHVREIAKIYEESHKDSIRERKQKYYQDNKERISEREKKYREDNRERINARKNELNRLKRENKKSIEILENIF